MALSFAPWNSWAKSNNLPEVPDLSPITCGTGNNGAQTIGGSNMLYTGTGSSVSSPVHNAQSFVALNPTKVKWRNDPVVEPRDIGIGLWIGNYGKVKPNHVVIPLDGTIKNPINDHIIAEIQPLLPQTHQGKHLVFVHQVTTI